MSSSACDPEIKKKNQASVISTYTVRLVSACSHRFFVIAYGNKVLVAWAKFIANITVQASS